jgi:hypothetical protein
MMRKNVSSLKKFFAMFLVICLCTMMSATAFAAEEKVPEENVASNSVGSILYSASAYFTKSTTLTITMTKGNWDADFLVTVIGNSGATYEVDMTTPSGTVYTSFITGGSGTFTNMKTLTYASKGTYTFKFTLLAGSEVSANALVEICD